MPVLNELTNDDAMAILRASLANGVKASSLCIAIIGWLCDTPTNPSIAVIRRSAEGRVWIRMYNEKTLEPICSFREFLEQVGIICDSLHMTAEQSKQMIALARQKLV